LQERDVRVDANGAVTALGQPCRLFHFSGFDPAHADLASRHSSQLRTAELDSVGTLYVRYARLLREAEHDKTRTWPYAYGRFDNGARIPVFARELYHGLGAAAERFGDPLETAPEGSFFRWLNGPVDGHDDPARRVSRLWDAVYRRRVDLQRAFPDHLGADRTSFLAWTVSSGLAEHGIDARLLGHRPA
jgi:hypothetical protein